MGPRLEETEKPARPERRCTSRQRLRPCQRLPQFFLSHYCKQMLVEHLSFWQPAKSGRRGYVGRYFRPTLYLLPEEYYTQNDRPPRWRTASRQRMFIILDVCWPNTRNSVMQLGAIHL